MKIFREIFGRVWAIWVILVFVSTMIIFLVPFLMFCYFREDPEKSERFIRYSRIWMAIFLYLSGCPLTIKGRDHFKKGENYIVLCNHNSFMDVPVSSPSIPGGNKTIAKIEMARIPVFGMLYRTGSVLVDRRDEVSRKDSYNKMKKVLAMGLHMCIYPEGSRNRSDQPLKAFHSGAFRLAMDTGRPIIPALIFNTRKALPANKLLYAMPHRLAIHFLPPVVQLPGEDAEGLRKRVFTIMEKYYVENT